MFFIGDRSTDITVDFTLYFFPNTSISSTRWKDKMYVDLWINCWFHDREFCEYLFAINRLWDQKVICLLINNCIPYRDDGCTFHRFYRIGSPMGIKDVISLVTAGLDPLRGWWMYFPSFLQDWIPMGIKDVISLVTAGLDPLRGWWLVSSQRFYRSVSPTGIILFFTIFTGEYPLKGLDKFVSSILRWMH